MVDISFRVAHEPGTTPFVDTSAFLGTNSTGDLMTSGLPVVRPESETSQSWS
jgi:hypothetical protein